MLWRSQIAVYARAQLRALLLVALLLVAAWSCVRAATAGTRPRGTASLRAAERATERLQPETAVAAYLDAAERAETLEQTPTALLEAARTLRYGLGANDSGQNQLLAADLYEMVARRGSAVERSDAAAELQRLSEEYSNRQAYLSHQQRADQTRQREQARGRIVAIEDAWVRRQAQHQQQWPPVPSVAHRPTPPAARRADSQNVHDPSVVASLRAGLEQLRAKDETPDDVSRAEQAVRSLLPRDSRAHAVVDRMMRNPVPLSAYGVTEAQVLATVWSRIEDPVNHDERKGMEDELVCQLEDSYYQDGSVVCANGRTARALQTLEGRDRAAAVSLRPKWAVDEEVRDAGAKLYADQLSASDPAVQAACALPEEDATEEQRDMQRQFKEQYEQTLQRSLSQAYDRILSADQVQAHVRQLADAI